MPKFVRIAIIVAAVPAVLFGSLQLWLWYKTTQLESFYQEHRLLPEMHTVQHDSTNGSGPAREALLQIVPLRMDKEVALAVLRREGFGCQTVAEPISSSRLRQHLLEARSLPNSSDDNRTGKSWLDCQVELPNVLGYVHWIVDLEFDANQSLVDTDVAVWNIFL
ncbi:MAG: hypothetical protein WBF59_02260 [Bradyrhizobium sp.]